MKINFICSVGYFICHVFCILILSSLDSTLFSPDPPSSESRWQSFDERTEGSSSTVGYCWTGKVSQHLFVYLFIHLFYLFIKVLKGPMSQGFWGFLVQTIPKISGGKLNPCTTFEGDSACINNVSDFLGLFFTCL